MIKVLRRPVEAATESGRSADNQIYVRVLHLKLVNFAHQEKSIYKADIRHACIKGVKKIIIQFLRGRA